MTCKTCGQEPCLCARERAEPFRSIKDVPLRSTYVPLPDGMSLDEFGHELFATIKLIGGMSGLQQQIAQAIHQGKGYNVQGFKDRRETLRHELARQIKTLTPDEMRRVLDHYPWVEAALKGNL